MSYSFGELPERFAEVLYPGIGPWSGNNNLGNVVNFAPDSNNRQSILTLPEMGFPEVWSVSLSIENADGVAVLAQVQAGCGGCVQEFEVDWQLGTRFSLPMNALNIVAQYFGTPTSSTGCRLSVQVARGACPSNAQASYRWGFTVPPGNTSATIAIPKFARRVNFANFSTNVGASALIFAATTTYGLWVDSAATLPTAVLLGTEYVHYLGGGGIPIPNEARYINIASGGGAGVGLSARAIFDLF